jgi:hypothetical protein
MPSLPSVKPKPFPHRFFVSFVTSCKKIRNFLRNLAPYFLQYTCERPQMASMTGNHRRPKQHKEIRL